MSRDCQNLKKLLFAIMEWARNAMKDPHVETIQNLRELQDALSKDRALQQ